MTLLDTLKTALRRLALSITRKFAVVWRRMMRLSATPHEVALGCAVGIFAAFTPFFGFQMLLAAGLAFGLRVSIAAALLATFAGNPLSWPAIWGASYVAGAWLLGHEPSVMSADDLSTSAALLATALTEQTPGAFDALLGYFTPVLKPMIIGSLAVGLLAATISYYPTRRAVRVFQDRHSHA